MVQEDEVCTHFSEAEDVSYVICEAERVEDGQEVEEGFVGRVGSPTFDWDAVCCDFGGEMGYETGMGGLTLIDGVAYGRVVD